MGKAKDTKNKKNIQNKGEIEYARDVKNTRNIEDCKSRSTSQLLVAY